MPQVIRRYRARLDLLDIWDYIEERSDAERADGFIRKIERKFEQLTMFPRSGRLRPELRPNLRSVPVGDYLILYYPLENGIQIERVLHGRRDLEAIDYKDEDDED